MNTDTRPSANKMMTVQEVALWFDVSPCTVWRWLRETDFPKPLMLGKSTRWDQQDIVNYIERKKQA